MPSWSRTYDCATGAGAAVLATYPFPVLMVGLESSTLPRHGKGRYTRKLYVEAYRTRDTRPRIDACAPGDGFREEAAPGRGRRVR